MLERCGAEVAGISLPPETNPSLFNLAAINRNMRSNFIDVRDSDAFQKEVFDFEPEIFFHLAAQPLVRRSYRDPIETFTTNVTGTVHALDAARMCDSVKAVVIVTTDKVYRNREEGKPFSEDNPLGGRDPYSASKAAAEMVVESYRRSFFLCEGKGLAAARAGNVIGGGDWSEDRILPDAVRAWAVGEALQVRHPDAVRPWQHVLEPICGYLRLAERIFIDPASSTDFNFGPDPCDASTVRDVVEIARLAFGGGMVDWGDKKNSLHEAGSLVLDNSKAKKELGIFPVWHLRETIKRTMHWYRRQADGENALTLCVEDIDAYLSAA
jgi:CDP-glucose 4,6-dehydratase